MASAAAQDGVGDAASHAAERALYRDHCISVALDVSCLLYQAADRAAAEERLAAATAAGGSVCLCGGINTQSAEMPESL